MYLEEEMFAYLILVEYIYKIGVKLLSKYSF